MTTAAPPHPPDATPLVILMRADATSRIGVGHAMRLLALAQELRSRSHVVHLAGSLEIDWVARGYADAGIGVHEAPTTPDGLAELAEALGAHVCVLDRYDLGAEWGATLRARGLAVMAMVDGEFSSHQDADLYVDQNPGSAPRPVELGRRSLAGADYTLFRDDVLALRRTRPRETPDGPLTVLAVFGGTDPLGAAPVVTPLLVDAADAAGTEMDLTVVSADAAWASDLNDALPDGVTLTTSSPMSDLAARAASCDLVITASGSSVWELLCLGVPTGVVCVIDNQQPGYDIVVADALAVGLGHLEALRNDPSSRPDAVHALARTLRSPRLRAERAARGQSLLDGQGRRRVADALLAMASSASARSDNGVVCDHDLSDWRRE